MSVFLFSKCQNLIFENVKFIVDIAVSIRYNMRHQDESSTALASWSLSRLQFRFASASPALADLFRDSLHIFVRKFVSNAVA